MMLRLAALLFSVALFATSVCAQMYQYRDEEGNLHFTDDLSQVPESLREQTVTTPTVEYSPPAQSPEEPESGPSIPRTEIWEDEVKRRAVELDRTRTSLEKKRERLEAEKKEILAGGPDENSTPPQIEAYQLRVRQLGEQIQAYEKERRQYEKKVEEFRSLTGGS